jgi:glucose-1-phosphate cytidylyltransferase
MGQKSRWSRDHINRSLSPQYRIAGRRFECWRERYCPVKVVILAGGAGTRLAEETETKPKPMVEIGGLPILWHIMKHYAYFGLKEFYVALGYKGEIIKRFFHDRCSLNGNMIIDLQASRVQTQNGGKEDWLIHLYDTGLDTNTGGRIRHLQRWLQDETFMVTYGDGVCNLDLRKLLAFHRSQGRIATVTAVRPPARFGGIRFDGDLVSEFHEKPQMGEGWINGGYMVFEPAVFRYLTNDGSRLEVDGLAQLARDRQLAAYRHEDFWQCMDTLREKKLLEMLWNENRAPWKLWED